MTKSTEYSPGNLIFFSTPEEKTRIENKLHSFSRLPFKSYEEGLAEYLIKLLPKETIEPLRKEL